MSEKRRGCLLGSKGNDGERPNSEDQLQLQPQGTQVDLGESRGGSVRHYLRRHGPRGLLGQSRFFRGRTFGGGAGLFQKGLTIATEPRGLLALHGANGRRGAAAILAVPARLRVFRSLNAPSAVQPSRTCTALEVNVLSARDSGTRGGRLLAAALLLVFEQLEPVGAPGRCRLATTPWTPSSASNAGQEAFRVEDAGPNRRSPGTLGQHGAGSGRQGGR